MDALARPPEQIELGLRQKLSRVNTSSPPIRIYRLQPRLPASSNESVSVVYSADDDLAFAVGATTAEASELELKTDDLPTAIEKARTLAARHFPRPIDETNRFVLLSAPRTTSPPKP